jgi:hypothetical protein
LYDIVTPILYKSISIKVDEAHLEEIDARPFLITRYGPKNLLRHVRNIELTSLFHTQSIFRCIHNKGHYPESRWEFLHRDVNSIEDEDIGGDDTENIQDDGVIKSDFSSFKEGCEHSEDNEQDADEETDGKDTTDDENETDRETYEDEDEDGSHFSPPTFTQLTSNLLPMLQGCRDDSLRTFT